MRDQRTVITVPSDWRGTNVDGSSGATAVPAKATTQISAIFISSLVILANTVCQIFRQGWQSLPRGGKAFGL
jgi:hypothetical protein